MHSVLFTWSTSGDRYWEHSWWPTLGVLLVTKTGRTPGDRCSVSRRLLESVTGSAPGNDFLVDIQKSNYFYFTLSTMLA
jgi:hypothetical protein